VGYKVTATSTGYKVNAFRTGQSHQQSKKHEREIKMLLSVDLISILGAKIALMMVKQKTVE
jgi:hypothetical protein